MRISVVCSEPNHPIFPTLESWAKHAAKTHAVSLHKKLEELGGGDLLFLVSCSELVRETHRNMFAKCFVIHASDLPKRRGWSPHIWAILEGETDIVVSLIEAKDPVDSGDIYFQRSFSVGPDELLEEINAKLFDIEIFLMEIAIDQYEKYRPRPQSGSPSYCRKRLPHDSMIDINESIVSQFDRIRLSDSVRFPAYFELYGYRYEIVIKKVNI